eukprot:TRINITY_DN19539_c0_g1_i1.p1 TRINITY_DN19539_c0_g1~~TRINITY_DN19539_c0_g1_i1.p1  ORF type:complete len:138 (-),score=29.96 TRINITY_DN19539_c0_g1_i1:66-479(-)
MPGVLTIVLSLAGMARAMGRNEKLGASELCEVTGDTKLGEGYSIAGTEICHQFCSLTTGCQFWTWYSRVLEEEVVKDNVCYALSRCDLVTQRCEQCSSGKKRTKSEGLSADEARKTAESIIKAEKRKRILNLVKDDL